MPIRLRLTVLFTAGALLLLGGLGVLFIRQLGGGLVSNLDGALRTRANELIGQLGPEGSNFSDPGQNPLLLPGGTYGQVLTVRAVIIQSSDGLGKQPLLTAAQAAGAAHAPVSIDVPVTLTTSTPAMTFCWSIWSCPSDRAVHLWERCRPNGQTTR